MPSTLTGTGASATQSTAPTASAPADGDSLAASGVQGPFQTILNHIAKLWAGAFAALGSNPALQATGSATRAGLNLVPQAAPSAPSDGDVWVETTSNQVKARVAGATQTLTPAAGTTPVAITPDANISVTSGAAYWKDSSGTVHLKGRLTYTGGTSTANFVTTTPLPVGFRPALDRQFPVANASGTVNTMQVTATGTIVSDITIGTGAHLSLDGITFLAEQ